MSKTGVFVAAHQVQSIAVQSVAQVPSAVAHQQEDTRGWEPNGLGKSVQQRDLHVEARSWFHEWFNQRI